jgi:AraC-like DNA-binding protein
MGRGEGLIRAQSSELQVSRSAVVDGILLARGTHLRHPYPRHWHEELHFCCYTSGSGYLGYRGGSHLVGEGDFVITSPGEVHENWVDPESSVSFCGIYIDAHAFRRAAQQITGRDLPLMGFRQFLVRNDPMKRHFLTIQGSAEQRSSQLEQEAALLVFLHAFFSNCLTENRPRIPSRREPGAVKRAREYIDENFAEAISLAFLSRLTNLSPFHLHRVFCLETGMPPHAYQTQVRINRAKQLLRERHSLSAVAVSTGFADQSHFTRHFRRVVGVTPGRFLS